MNRQARGDAMWGEIEKERKSAIYTRSNCSLPFVRVEIRIEIRIT